MSKELANLLRSASWWFRTSRRMSLRRWWWIAKSRGDQVRPGAFVPHLEAVANIHYLLDQNIDDPESLKELRLLEEKVFGEMLQIVLEQLKEGQTRSG